MNKVDVLAHTVHNRHLSGHEARFVVSWNKTFCGKKATTLSVREDVAALTSKILNIRLAFVMPNEVMVARNQE
jgi:hypothetical protein